MDKMEINKKMERLFILFKGLKALKDIKEKMKKKRSCAVRKINHTRNRFGYYKVTFMEIKNLDQQQFFIHTRMTREVFDMLLELVRPQMIEKSRNLLSCEFRLALTLLYLSQGCSFQSLAWSWKVGKETVRKIIYETCDALWSSLSGLYVTEPNITEISKTAEDFYQLWNFPNWIGAIDGKHIAIKCPPKTGSQFFNYKGFYSTVLLAACDARYVFTHIDVGAYGSQHDGGIFSKSSFGKRLALNKLSFPEPTTIPGTDQTVPHFFVADAAFPLTPHIMKPYPGVGLSKEKEIFNRRLSRARRCIENAFGILVCRWRILLTTLNMFPDNADKIVCACVALHNFLRLNKEAKNLYLPPKFVDWDDVNHNIQSGMWRQEVNQTLTPLQPSRNLHVLGGSNALKIRDTLCRYVNTEGRLNWMA